MNTYEAYYGERSVTVRAENPEEARRKAALLLGMGRRTWTVRVRKLWSPDYIKNVHKPY